MSKRLILVLACLVAVQFSNTGRAHAQTADADVKAAAKEVMVAMKVVDQWKAILPTVLNALKPVIVQGRAEVERDYDTIQRQVLDVFEKDMNELMDAMTIVYARHFTAAELRDLAKFMNGPTGQKFVDKMPVVFQEGMLVGQKFGEQAAHKARAKIIEELRKRGHNI
jgi:hypothetical protein